MSNEIRCGNCKYWVRVSRDQRGDVGQCRRYPPRRYNEEAAWITGLSHLIGSGPTAMIGAASIAQLSATRQTDHQKWGVVSIYDVPP